MPAATYPHDMRDRGITGRTGVHFAAADLPLGRLAVMAGPAAIITLLLFVGMTGLIRVDQLPDVQKTTRVLEPIPIPQEVFPPPAVNVLPIPPDEILLPPPPAVGTTRGDAPSLPKEVIFEPPRSVPSATPVLRPPMVSPVVDRRAIAVRKPAPDYPVSAIEKGLSGSCEVRFSLTSRGLPFDITAVCTHPEFEREALRSVGKAQFLPQVRDGQAVEAHNLVYPLEFTLE
ncbi:MAG TPA: TonB family protein [Hyphomonas sp.]|nr:TonB family protein [Hyphomonas sp.]MCB9960685.1 TonB family protein [Hyphomonas sp.]HPE48796.1 TonB family protein [Hyphomonas sp.]